MGTAPLCIVLIPQAPCKGAAAYPGAWCRRQRALPYGQFYWGCFGSMAGQTHNVSPYIRFTGLSGQGGMACQGAAIPNPSRSVGYHNSSFAKKNPHSNLILNLSPI